MKYKRHYEIIAEQNIDSPKGPRKATILCYLLSSLIASNTEPSKNSNLILSKQTDTLDTTTPNTISVVVGDQGIMIVTKVFCIYHDPDQPQIFTKPIKLITCYHIRQQWNLLHVCKAF